MKRRSAKRCTATPAGYAARPGCGRSRGPEPLPRPLTLSRGRGLGGGDIAIIQTSLHRKRFVQPAISQAVNLLHFDLHRNAVFHRLHVADHPDNLTAGVKGIQGVQRRVRRQLIELLERCAAEDRYDFVTDILVRYKNLKRIYAYKLGTYWSNIASVDSYYKTNMDFLKPDVRHYFFKEYPEI